MLLCRKPLGPESSAPGPVLSAAPAWGPADTGAPVGVEPVSVAPGGPGLTCLFFQACGSRVTARPREVGRLRPPGGPQEAMGPFPVHLFTPLVHSADARSAPTSAGFRPRSRKGNSQQKAAWPPVQLGPRPGFPPGHCPALRSAQPHLVRGPTPCPPGLKPSPPGNEEVERGCRWVIRAQAARTAEGPPGAHLLATRPLFPPEAASLAPCGPQDSGPWVPGTRVQGSCRQALAHPPASPSRMKVPREGGGGQQVSKVPRSLNALNKTLFTD